MKLGRRQFLSAAGLAGAAAYAQGGWKQQRRTKARAQTRNTARNLIFILLEGGPSHIDTFDLKTGPWLPSFMGVTDLGGGFQWPAGIMPELATMTNRFTVVRSISAVEAVHERAVYQLLTGHRQNAALVNEIPHFASILSYKAAAERTAADSLPTAMVIGRPPARNGFLPVDHRPLELGYNGGIQNLNHWYQGSEQRFGLLDGLLAEMEFSDARADRKRNLVQARAMMLDEELKTLLTPDEEEDNNYFLGQCKTAVRVLAANKGTRAFQMTLGGWDHHDTIYNENDQSLSGLCRTFDAGFAYLIRELDNQPASRGQGSLLDETMVVAMGEFGRTTGELNTSGGRDHFPYVVPAVVAGGGMQMGRVIGSTTSDGSAIIDPGWSQNRLIGVNDLVASLYSALGVDWTERFEDTPSGRVFEIVDPGLYGTVYDIDTLFV